LPLLAAAASVAAMVGAAFTETPTFDEYAHVPAGAAHWRHGAFHLHPYNPPLGKMWMALPAALDPGVETPRYEGDGVHWAPWFYGQEFLERNREKYLGLIARARLMIVPLVLLTGAIVYAWTRSLFGPFAAAMSTMLFLLSPTVLAHGHMATLDAASMATIALAAYALRWSARTPTWPRVLAGGGALGLALAVKYSALFLLIVAPPLWAALAWPALAGRVGAVAGRLAGYLLAAWVALNASMGFAGTFDKVGSLDARSEFVGRAARRLPESAPILLPRDYLRGLDVLQYETETGQYPGYFRGEWTTEGRPYYYFAAFAIKEPEVVVLLAVLSLAALPALGRRGPPWREAAAVLAPLAMFLILVAFSNTINWGLRYVLPAYPFVFILMGSCFRWIEIRLERSAAGETSPPRVDRRWWIAGPLAAYMLALTAWNYPGYLGYFNVLVGGPEHGDEWLVGSNLEWGQDLYRLPEAARRLGVERWKLLYFGNVDPSLYGIEYELAPGSPEPGVYAVSVSFLRGMPCAVLFEGGPPHEVHDRAAWLARLTPTERLGGMAVFDLREDAPRRLGTGGAYSNAAAIELMLRRPESARDGFREAIAREPGLADAHFGLGLAATALGEHAEAVRAYRETLRLHPERAEAINNLAWYLSVGPESGLRNPAEAVILAKTACRLTSRRNLAYLDTLAGAYASAGRWKEAVEVCREGLAKADAAGRIDAAERFRGALADFESHLAGRRE
jgi:tetratricopeptide (TPR) repeat protein